MLEEHGWSAHQLNHVYIGGRFRCSSTEVTNGVFDHIGRSISTDQRGILSFEVDRYADKNKLEQWPLSQLVTKSPFIQTIKIKDLYGTTAENRQVFMNFVGELCSITDSCLHTLHLERTFSSGEDGAKLWESIADSSLESLKHLTIVDEYFWFEDGR